MNIILTIILWVTYVLSLYFSIFFLLIFLERGLVGSRTKYGKLMNAPEVTVIIPAYNEEENIDDTLRSVLRLDYPKEKLYVIIVNDGSTDKTAERVQKFIADKPHFSLLSHQNRGKAASLNRALAHVKSEFFACLDADSFVDRNALRRMLELYYAEKDPKLAIITPAMKVKNPKTILQKVQWIEYLIMVLISRLAGYIDCLYVAPGPFSLYRTKVIKELKGFDEHNLTEDQEIAYRVQYYHYKIKQCPTAFVHTLAPAFLRPFFRQRRRWYKGSLSCLHKYRSLILNRTYGDFGVVQMMKNCAGFFIAVSGMLFAFYFAVLPVIEKFQHLLLIDFDIWPYLQNLTFTYSVMSIDIQKVFIVGVLFSIGGVFFLKAHPNGHERLNKIGLLPVIPYFFFYYVLKGGILLMSIAEYALGRRQKWE